MLILLDVEELAFLITECMSVGLKGSDVITYNYLHSIILFLEPIMSLKYFKIGFMQWPRKYINDIGTRLKVWNRLLTNTEKIKLAVCFNIFKYKSFYGFHGWFSINRHLKFSFFNQMIKYKRLNICFIDNNYL